MAAWDIGAISVIYMSRSLDLDRVETDGGEVIYCKRDEVVYDVSNRQGLDDWILDNFKTIGSDLQLVGNGPEEGAQFEKGLGGLAALLRFPVTLSCADTPDFDDSDFAL
jgi:peptide subunit release factor 1 (eRF1)